MMRTIFIGLGAGVAAALLFASVTSGVWLSIPLFYLAPLPLMIAGLGWSHWAAVIAGMTGALSLSIAFGPIFFFLFLAGAGIPAAWLTYLAMLARPVTNGGEPTLEWYPPGRLVIWGAILGALMVVVAIPKFGADAESFRSGLRDVVMHLLRVEIDAPAATTPVIPGISNTGRLIDFLVAAVPPAAAVLATITNIFNLWLAARIVKFSGLLKRPWPLLPALTFPKLLIAALALAVILSFAGGLLGIVAGVLSASLLMAYGVLGFAVLHAITQGMDARIFVLGGVYAAVLVFGWPVLALCTLGLIETAIDLRARIAQKRGPPART
jgi:hypothetical protein